MPEQNDVEVTLGTGKLLLIFFSLVVLCGIFFGFGYSLGRSSADSAVTPSDSQTVAVSGGSKPAAGKEDAPAKPAAEDLSFYETVDQANPEAKLTEPAPETQPADAQETAPATQLVRGYTVQIAAVSKQEDAEALAAALRSKKYNAFINNQPGDRLYHVQVGPFAELKQAETMRARLTSDGYSPIVKK